MALAILDLVLHYWDNNFQFKSVMYTPVVT